MRDEFTVYASNSVVGAGSAAAIIAVGELPGDVVFIDCFVLVWSGDKHEMYDKQFYRVHSSGGASATTLDPFLWTDYGRSWAGSRLLAYLDEWRAAVADRPLPMPFNLNSESDPALLRRLWLFGACRQAIKDSGRTTHSNKLRDYIAELRKLPEVRADPG